MPIDNKGVYRNVYIHEDYHRNEIREFLLENATYSTRPSTTTGEDKGLMYFDTEVNRIIVWNGTDWKIVRYFDDRDIQSNDNINMQDIWAESGTVASLTEDEAKGITGSQTVIQYWQNRVTTYIPDSWSFYTDEMEAVVFAKNFDSGATYSDFYEPVVTTYLGATVSSDLYQINEYNVGPDTQYRIEFLDGSDMVAAGVTTINVPRVTFFKYVGDRLSLTYINGSVNKFQFLGSSFAVDPNNSDRRRRSLAGTGVTSFGEVGHFSMNGQELSFTYYFIYEESGVYYISIDTSASGTNWVDEGDIESDDTFYLSVLNLD